MPRNANTFPILPLKRIFFSFDLLGEYFISFTLRYQYTILMQLVFVTVCFIDGNRTRSKEPMSAGFSSKFKSHQITRYNFLSIQKYNPAHWPRKFFISFTPTHAHIQ